MSGTIASGNTQHLSWIAATAATTNVFHMYLPHCGALLCSDNLHAHWRPNADFSSKSYESEYHKCSRKVCC